MGVCPYYELVRLLRFLDSVERTEKEEDINLGDVSVIRERYSPPASLQTWVKYF